MKRTLLATTLLAFPTWTYAQGTIDPAVVAAANAAAPSYGESTGVQITAAPGDCWFNTGCSLTDAQGNVWSIGSRSDTGAMGQVLKNGQTDSGLDNGSGGWIISLRLDQNGQIAWQSAKGWGWANQSTIMGANAPSAGSGNNSTSGSSHASATATPAVDAATTTQSTSAAGQCTIPGQAAVAGYTTMTFGPSLKLGSNIFLKCPGAATQNSDGSITIPGGACNHFNDQIDTGNILFGGGAYIQSTISFKNTPAGWPGVDGWPAYWGTSPSSGPHVEVDAFEYMTAGVSNKFDFGLQDWQNSGSVTWAGDGGYGMPTAANLPAGFDPSQPHKYGLLWVPASGSTKGMAQVFVDGQQVGPTYSWSPGGPWSSLDGTQLQWIFGTGSTNPMTVYDMEVWQKDNSADSGASPSGGGSTSCAVASTPQTAQPGQILGPLANATSLPPSTDTQTTPADLTNQAQQLSSQANNLQQSLPSSSQFQSQPQPTSTARQQPSTSTTPSGIPTLAQIGQQLQAVQSEVTTIQQELTSYNSATPTATQPDATANPIQTVSQTSPTTQKKTKGKGGDNDPDGDSDDQ